MEVHNRSRDWMSAELKRLAPPKAVDDSYRKRAQGTFRLHDLGSWSGKSDDRLIATLELRLTRHLWLLTKK